MLSPNDSKQAKVQARRDQIVEAAKTSFRRHGFHAASMAEIAQWLAAQRRANLSLFRQ